MSDQVNSAAKDEVSADRNGVKTDKSGANNGLKRLLIVIAVVAAFGALFAFGLFNDQSDRSNIGSPFVDKAVPAFTMPLFARYVPQYGDTFSFAAQEGQPMVINFWASWCGPCIVEAPQLEAASQEFGDEVLFVGVNTLDGSPEDAQAFIDRFNLTFPNGRDEQSRVSVDYGLFGVPETFFINADGTLNYRHSGPITADVLEEQMQALVQE